MHEIIAFVDREGNQGIRRIAATADNFDDLVTRLRGVSAPPPAVPVYVFYTFDMFVSYGSMRFLADQIEHRISARVGRCIRWLPCERLVDDRAYCSEQIFDLRTGSIERHLVAPALTAKPVSLRRTVMIKDGHVVRQRDYTENPDSVQLTMEIVLTAEIWPTSICSMSRHSNQILIRCSCWADSMTSFSRRSITISHMRVLSECAPLPNESVGDS